MGLVLELKEFSGPLDLLLHLIGSARKDIKDIFVSQVTEQYIRIIQETDTMDMEDTSEFIQMAATLLLIKSRSILPVVPTGMEEGEENPEELLIRQLEEYARFQLIAAQMQEFEQAASRLFSKLPDEYSLPPIVYELGGLTLDGLIEAFARMSAKLNSQETEEPLKRSVIQLDQHSVSHCMSEILRKTRKGSIRFSNLFSRKPSRNEVVTLFLALLELLKQGRLRVYQERSEEDILLMRNSRGEKINEE